MNGWNWGAAPAWAHGLEWGTVPAWVSAFLTSGSFLLGFYILLRDRRKEERHEAEQVICWLETQEERGPDGMPLNSNRYIPHVANFAERPVSAIHLIIAGGRDEQNRREVLTGRIAPVIRPGEEVVGDVFTVPDSGVKHAIVAFLDGDGTEWSRDLMPDLFGQAPVHFEALRGKRRWPLEPRALRNVHLHGIYGELNLTTSKSRRKALRRMR